MIKHKSKPSHDFNGFMVTIFYDQPDNDWVAYFDEMPNISAFGDTPALALDELQIAWNLMKEVYEEDGIAIPKPLMNYETMTKVAVDSNIHRSLLQEANEQHTSLALLVSQKLSQVSSFPLHTNI
jgi:predicted RNase H-like HicB family nuclease